MENSAQFDLNGKIQQWRTNLAGSPALGIQELEELEAHLVDSFEALHASGVEAAEAFAIALRRLGTNGELQAEFAKVNAQRVWSERALWILCGVLGANILWAFVSFFSNVVINVSIWSGLGPHPVGALRTLTSWVASVLLIWLSFRLVVRHAQHLHQAAGVALRKPVWTGLVLIFALEALQWLPFYGMRWLEPLWQHIADPGRRLPPGSDPIINGWLMGGFLLGQALWISSVPFLAAYAWRKRTESGVWPERALWVVIGIVLSRFFAGLILEPSSILLAFSRSASVFVQQLAGFGSLTLCVGVFVAVVLAFSKAVDRYQAQWNWIGRLCRKGPARGAILCLIACAAVETSLYFVVRLISPPQHGISVIGSSWLQANSLLTMVVIPTAMLLWLARRRQARLSATDKAQ